jgi:RNA polymerase sigma-70 factor (ECF subfamily)
LQEAANVVVTERPGVHEVERGTNTFDDVFRALYPQVHGLLYRVTGSDDEADDLAQDVFLQLYRREPPIWTEPEAEGWLWRAASHAALNALRNARRRRAREERVFHTEEPQRLFADGAEDPVETITRRAQQEAVRETLRRLKPQESSLLLLRHTGLSYAEIGEALQLNPASVGTLLRRAEARFKEKYHG